MIMFNGVWLDSVAPVMIEDIRISPIPLNITARQRPIKFGADFVRVSGSPRTVAITFGLLTQDITARQYYLSQITAWARTPSPAALSIPSRPGVHLMALCTNLPEPSMRQWWESKLRLVFTAYDPYWISDAEQSVACGTAFTVMGDAPPLMRIESASDSARTDLTYSDGTDSMVFSSVGTGTLVIDLNNQTAAIGGTSIMEQYTFTSKFLQPKTGAQTITGAGTIYWRERWE